MPSLSVFWTLPPFAFAQTCLMTKYRWQDLESRSCLAAVTFRFPSTVSPLSAPPPGLVSLFFLCSSVGVILVGTWPALRVLDFSANALEGASNDDKTPVYFEIGCYIVAVRLSDAAERRHDTWHRSRTCLCRLPPHIPSRAEPCCAQDTAPISFCPFSYRVADFMRFGGRRSVHSYQTDRPLG